MGLIGRKWKSGGRDGREREGKSKAEKPPVTLLLHLLPSDLQVFLSRAWPAAHMALLCPGHGVKAEYRNAEIPECRTLPPRSPSFFRRSCSFFSHGHGRRHMRASVPRARSESGIPECQSTEMMKRLNSGTPKRRNAEVPECRKTGMAGNLSLPRTLSGSPALTIIRTTVRVNLFYTKKFNFSAKLIIWRKNGEKNRAYAARFPMPGNDGCNIRPAPGDEYPYLRKTHRYRPTFRGNQPLLYTSC